MHDVMCAIKRTWLNGMHYVMGKIFNYRIVNNNLWYNIIVLVWHSNLIKENYGSFVSTF